MFETGQCPCGGVQGYQRCCARWHAGAEYLMAPTAEALMRSRFVAFALDRRDYLLATWHLSTRPSVLAAPPSGLLWLGLEVKRHSTIDEHHAEVEFVARSKQAGRAVRLHEISRFVREAGRWYYVDGDLKPQR